MAIRGLYAASRLGSITKSWAERRPVSLWHGERSSCEERKWIRTHEEGKGQLQRDEAKASGKVGIAIIDGEKKEKGTCRSSTLAVEWRAPGGVMLELGG